MMPDPCFTTTSYAAILTAWGLGAASFFQLWQLELRLKGLPKVREIGYHLDVAPIPYETTGALAISKVRQGGPPWYTFPPEIRRTHLEALYEVVIREGKPPLERHMLKHMSRRELRILRDHLYENEWAEYQRNGLNAPWLPNAQGRANIIYWYLRLNGKIPTQAKPKRIMKEN